MMIFIIMSTDQTDTDEADDRQKGELYFTFQAIFFSHGSPRIFIVSLTLQILGITYNILNTSNTY